MAKKRSISELEADLEETDRRIAQLKDELEEERNLTHKLAEQVRDTNDMIDQWIQAFDMVPNESGVWKWSRDFVQGEEWFERYRTLVRKWNRLVPDYNATTSSSCTRQAGRCAASWTIPA